ncbi:DUF3667 domain-containing protein [Arenimonas sp. MALMAid1274]|uniref:DUF3667 domain-containing protein n=1 Tax=Arenimonas sp. MALMAid1274 TaxID=3411630 RepID=UPI003B9DCB07
MTIRTCPGCSAAVDGPYCPACGQRQPQPGDFGLRHLAGEAWEEVSNTDSRLWRTLGGIFRPGLLTRAWLDYRWQQYFPPLRLYLLLSGVYFLLAWDVTFQINVDQVRALPEGAMPAPVREVYLDDAAANLVGDLTALFKFASVLVMGLWVALLHLGNRAPIGAHMVYALHYTVFDFAVYSLLTLVIALVPAADRLAVFTATLPLGMFLLFLWASLASRRVYGRSWPGSLVRGAAVAAMDFVLSVVSGQLAVVVVILTRM